MEENTIATLTHSELRALDGQPAHLRIGDKYPIVTTQFVSPEPDAIMPPPMFQWEDLGLTLKVTPKVHGTTEVTLEIEAEVKALGSGGYNGLPVITNRQFTNRARLKFGEWAVIAGLISSEEAKTLSGIAGFSSIPVIGPLFSRNTKRKNDAEALVIIKPHLLNAGPDELATRAIWTGTESRPLSPL